MQLEVMKWRNYFFDDVMRGANLGDRNFLHSVISVNYTSEFRDVFQATMFRGKLFFSFPSLSKEILDRFHNTHNQLHSKSFPLTLSFTKILPRDAM